METNLYQLIKIVDMLIRQIHCYQSIYKINYVSSENFEEHLLIYYKIINLIFWQKRDNFNIT